MDYVREGVGARKSEPEFIELSGGLLKRNPNYLKRHAPHVACTSEPIFARLLQWWADTHATPAQKQILADAENAHKTTISKNGRLSELLMRSYDGAFTTSYAPHTRVTFEEFQNV